LNVTLLQEYPFLRNWLEQHFAERAFEGQDPWELMRDERKKIDGATNATYLTACRATSMGRYMLGLARLVQESRSRQRYRSGILNGSAILSLGYTPAPPFGPRHHNETGHRLWR